VKEVKADIKPTLNLIEDFQCQLNEHENTLTILVPHQDADVRVNAETWLEIEVAEIDEDNDTIAWFTIYEESAKDKRQELVKWEASQEDPFPFDRWFSLKGLRYKLEY
jgi:hypothetical protein